MEIKEIPSRGGAIAEVISPEVLIRSAQDALDLMANAPLARIVLHEHNFERDFFDLSTGKLGEILQKFVSYRVRLAIVGDFDKYPSASLKAFVYESNKVGAHLFVGSAEEARRIWEGNTG